MGEIVFFLAVVGCMFLIFMAIVLMLKAIDVLTAGFINHSPLRAGLALVISLFIVPFSILYGVQYYALEEASVDWFGKNGVVIYSTVFCIFLGVIGLFVEVFRFFVDNNKNKRQREQDSIAMTKAEEEKKIEAQKQREQEDWQKQLDREIERERRLAEVRHESTIMAMQAQVKLYAEYKEKGLDIERQVFDMRKTLIELEGHENKAMLDDVRKALDDL